MPDIYQWQQATESVTWKEALELSGLQAYRDIDTQLHYTSGQILEEIENPFCGEWSLSLLARIYEALLSFGYADVYLTDEFGYSYRIVDICAIKQMDILYWHGGILTPDYRFYFATGPDAYNGVLCGDREDVLDMVKMANLEGHWMEEKEAH